MATALTFPISSLRSHRRSTEAERAARREAVTRHPSARVVPLVEPIPEAGPSTGLSIVSCSDCTRRDTSACSDCVVTFVCGSIVELRSDEAEALAMFQSVGLVPQSRHQSALVAS
jgi:hypothetical protein